MALTFNGTRNKLPASQKPDGYTDPSVNTFSDYEHVKTATFNVAKASVIQTNAEVTMLAIFNEGSVGLNTQVSLDVSDEFDTTRAVTAFADLIELRHKYDQDAADPEGYLKSGTSDSFEAKVVIYVKVA